MTTVLLTIGDFSRMTHLSIKALRHYHDVGLLEPAEIDRDSGYRRYDAEQVPVAQVIRRFRDLGMPVDEVKAVLDAPDVETRNRVIVAHLERMEDQLAQTQATVASLRTVLEGQRGALPVEFRTVEATPALVIRERVTKHELESQWWFDALRDLRKVVDELGAVRAGPDGCLYPGEMFELEEGEMVAFVPVSGRPAGSGRVKFEMLPAVELAVTMHEGTYGDLDQTYGALGTFVAERAIGVEGPIREHYLVGPFQSESEPEWRTEVCWPVFRTAG
jgi:DNA-binding transcriptional MerR regulator